MFRTIWLPALIAAQQALCHFTLDYPPSRGFIDDLEGQFCGSFLTPNTSTPFPLSGGIVQIDTHHDEGVAAILLSFDQSATSFANFSDGSSSSPFLFNFTELDSGEGEYCLYINPSTYPGISNGTQATIQVQVTSDDGSLYQCADVVFTDSATVPSSVTCDSNKNVNSSNIAAESSASAALSSLLTTSVTNLPGVASATVGPISAASSLRPVGMLLLAAMGALLAL